MYFAREKMLFVFQVVTSDNAINEMIRERHRAFPGIERIRTAESALNVRIDYWQVVNQPWAEQFSKDNHCLESALYIPATTELDKRLLGPESVALLEWAKNPTPWVPSKSGVPFFAHRNVYFLCTFYMYMKYQ